MTLGPEQALPMDLFLDLDRSGPVPLYHQIATRLERAIRDETLPAGARLENEVALGNRLGLSRPTVRRAIQELVDRGLLVRRRGIGTQVVHGRVTRDVELTSLYEDLARSGQRPETEVLSSSVDAADAPVSEALGVEMGSPVLRITRLRKADGVPLALLDNVLPAEYVDLDMESLETHGLYQLLRGRGVNIRVAKQRIGARASTTSEGELLDVRRGSALLTMTRTAFDSSGRAVEHGEHCYRPDLYAFEVTLVDR
ncbi:GntR family transcriptional regulator [Clavibacter michiganensis]|uniref:GntR family transcriptional regulator n=1 Tax=Clavibacter michiganensis subsp. insidiosus TaxID=33014 RepID=A0A0D5CN50_9MICO|nr:GntR family transcriptional regulator [Clavibacter michiganensis]AJW80729.1 GntR family transcriptional regulator [Clavibacter michiganensis subsp. insidiosus]AWF99927.1 GntR family transcriptional regulator [Clavibacter michiganensis subsp. insidiosus]